ncbi:MAG: cytochrome c [Magnetococcales bacterium]|nr:cytochrome c [Magnetococcales bacterium]
MAIAVVLLAVMGRQSVQADESAIAMGKALHEGSCLSCHAARFGGDPYKIYTREDRRKKDKESLLQMVAFCNQQVGTGWFDDEVEAVTDYLDATYYRFKPE